MLASTSDAGLKGNGVSFHAQLSADGSKLAFQSNSTNLTEEDTDTINDIYLKDLATGEVTLASTSDNGVKGNNDSSDCLSLTPDGSRVAFASSATNLDPADTDVIADIYVKNMINGDITLASISDKGIKSNGNGGHTSLSADGMKVAFYSSASNLHPADTDTQSDIFVKNLSTGEMTLASTSDTGLPANGESTFPFMSADGTTVAFGSSATNLDPADTDPKSDLYVKNLLTGDISLASITDQGVKGNSESLDPWLTPDGSVVAFTSAATNLDPSDTNAKKDVFVKNLVTGELVLASRSEAGLEGNGLSAESSLSADGTMVAFFSQSTNLDPADGDKLWDTYMKDLSTGDLTLVSITNDGVKGDGDSGIPSLSSDGGRVAFPSKSTNLDPRDADTFRDVYVKELDEDTPSTCVKSQTNVTINVAAGGDVTIGRSGPDLWVTGAGIADPTCGGATVTNVDTVYVTGDVEAETLILDLSGGSFAPGASVESSGLSEIEFNLALGGGSDELSILGSSGVDKIIFGSSAVKLNGDTDQDLAYSFIESFGATGDGDADVLSGAGGGSTGTTLQASLSLVGGAGSDKLTGGTANDALTGSDGNDTLKGRAGADSLDGGAGLDTVLYSGSPLGVSINLGSSSTSPQSTSGGHALGDTLAAFERATGSSFDDVLHGSSVANTLEGRAGNDSLSSYAANDKLVGGPGTDSFDGGAGTDNCDETSGETAVSCEK